MHSHVGEWPKQSRTGAALKRRWQRNQVIDVILEFSNDDSIGWEQGKVIALVLKALRTMGEHTEDGEMAVMRMEMVLIRG